MKLLIAITGTLICIGTASASPLTAATPVAASSRVAESTVTDLSSRKLIRGQFRKFAPGKRLADLSGRKLTRGQLQEIVPGKRIALPVAGRTR